MSGKIYIGIDPGASGGLCALLDEGVRCTKMPSTERDIWAWFEEIREWTSHPCITLDAFAVIEWINPGYIGSSKSSMSKLYGSYRALRMCLVAASIPFEDIKAHAWQRAMGITKGGMVLTQTEWKNKLKAKAQCLFPRERVTLHTADALLIAEYCHRKCEGKLVLPSSGRV